MKENPKHQDFVSVAPATGPHKGSVGSRKKGFMILSVSGAEMDGGAPGLIAIPPSESFLPTTPRDSG